MPPEFRARLPQWLAEVVDEIEGHTGFPIDVVIAGAPEEALKAQLDLEYARIITPSPERFTPASVFHELLHIRRHLVEGVPRLDAADDVPDEAFELVRQAATNEDNAIEHLLIVPLELERFPERKEHWDAVVQRNVARISALQGTPQDLDATAIGQWVFTRRAIPGAPVEPILERLLQQRGLEQRANDALVAVLPALGDKRALTRAWFASTGQDITRVCFEVLNTQAHVREYEPALP